MPDRPFSADPTYGIEEKEPLNHPGREVTAMVWSPDGKQFAAGCEDGSLLLWDELHQSDPPRRRMVNNSMITNIDWSGDGKYLACCTESGDVLICDSQSLRPVPGGSRVLSREALLRVAWEPNTRSVAACGLDRKLYLFDPFDEGGEWNVRTAIGHYSPIESIVWSHDGRTVLSGTHNGVVGIWTEGRIDNQLRNFISDNPWSHDAPVVDLAWSRQGARVVSASYDGFLRFWSAPQFEPLGSYDCGVRVFAVGFSADGEVTIARTAKGLVFLDSWHLKEIAQQRSRGDLDNSQMAVSQYASQVAVDDAINARIRIYRVRFNDLISKSRALHQRYKCARISLLTGKGVQATKVARSLALASGNGIPVDDKFERHVLSRDETHPDSDSTEIREICLRLNRHQECELLDPLRDHYVSGILSVFDWSSANEDFGSERFPARPRGKTTALFVAGVNPSHKDAGDHILASKIRDFFDVDRIYSLNGRPEEIENLRAAIASRIDWQEISELRQAHILDHICVFLANQRKSKKGGSGLAGQESDVGMVFESQQTLHDLFIGYNQTFKSPDSYDLFAASIKMLETAGLIHYFAKSESILLGTQYLDEYVAAIGRQAQMDPDGLGRVLLEDPRVPHQRPGKALDVPADFQIPDRAQESRFFESVILELEEQKAYQIVTNAGKYLVVPSQCKQRMSMPGPENRSVTFKFEGSGSSVLSALIVRLRTLPIFFLKPSNLYANGAVFTTDTEEQCGIYLKTSETATHSEISTFFQGDASAGTKRLFLAFARYLIKTTVLSYTVDERESADVFTGAVSRDVLMVCEPTDTANVKQIAAVLGKRNINPLFEDELVPAGTRYDERVATINRFEVAVVALGAGKSSAPVEDNHQLLMRSGCRVIPILLPTAPIGSDLPDSLLGCKAVDFHVLGQEPYDRLIMGILAAQNDASVRERRAMKVELPSGPGPILSPKVRKKIFVSYSHRDEPWMQRLLVHLKPLAQDGLLDIWHDEQIKAGSLWQREIDNALRSAAAAVLLISADFLASDFIANNELPPLLAAAEHDGLKIFPLILSQCRFSETAGLSRYQSLNSPARPLQKLSRADREDVFYEVSKKLEALVSNTSVQRAGIGGSH